MFYYNIILSDCISLVFAYIQSCKDVCACVSQGIFKQMTYLNVVNFSAKYVHLVHIQVVALKKKNHIKGEC